MDFLTILLIAVGLAMDALAVSLGIGTTQLSSSLRARLRLAWHFGFFQFMMPVIGWFAGTLVDRWISPVDHWIAFGLLAYVGGHMIRSGFDAERESFASDPSRGKTLVVLTIATSIDSLAVGLSMAMINVNIYYPAIVIGIVTFVLSMLGSVIGNKLGEKFGKRMEIIGGMILIGIGLRILISHLTGG